MIRAGIIGLGMMGRCHYASWDAIDGATVTAIADSDPRRAEGDLSGGWSNIDGGAEAFDMARITGTTDPLELIGMADVDVVDVCVPTPFHAELAIAALKAGKHVVCEKPLARTAAQARDIVAAAEEAQGLFMPAMCIRFWPQWAWLKGVIEAGTYGPVRGATFRRVASMPPGWFGNAEMSGAAALDLHLHDTDFVHFLFGVPKAVQSQGYSKTTDGVDFIMTQYLYDDGPMASAEGGWCFADGSDFSMRYTVNFANATADYDMARDAPLIVAAGGEKEAITCDAVDGYFAELAYMAECIKSGTAPTIVTAAEAAESIRIVEAEVQSVQTGQVVEL